MKILAIDSSGLTAAAAVYVDGVIRADFSINNKKTHSQVLLPMIDRVLSEAGVLPKELDAVAVGEGPGSFTGLRIGAATAKGLCLSINKPIIPVSSLAIIAYNLAACSMTVCPIMDARRNQVYTASYRFDNDGFKVIHEPAAMGIEECIDRFDDNEKVMFAGDGVPVFRMTICEKMGKRAYFAPPHLNLQNSAAAAVYAAELYEKGKYIDAREFRPVYLRLSQAERERLEREANGKK